MSANFVVRRAEPSDAEALTRLAEEVSGETLDNDDEAAEPIAEEAEQA